MAKPDRPKFKDTTRTRRDADTQAQHDFQARMEAKPLQHDFQARMQAAAVPPAEFRAGRVLRNAGIPVNAATIAATNVILDALVANTAERLATDQLAQTLADVAPLTPPAKPLTLRDALHLDGCGDGPALERGGAVLRQADGPKPAVAIVLDQQRGVAGYLHDVINQLENRLEPALGTPSSPSVGASAGPTAATPNGDGALVASMQDVTHTVHAATERLRALVDRLRL